MTADLKADHPGTKCLEQHLDIGRIVAEVRDNQRIAMVAAVNRRQRARPRASKQTLRQFFDVANSEQALPVRTVAADDRSRTIAAAADIMGDDHRPETRPG